MSEAISGTRLAQSRMSLRSCGLHAAYCTPVLWIPKGVDELSDRINEDTSNQEKDPQYQIINLFPKGGGSFRHDP